MEQLMITGKTKGGIKKEKTMLNACENPNCDVRSIGKEEESRRVYIESKVDVYLTITGCQWKSQLENLKKDNYPLPRK